MSDGAANVQLRACLDALVECAAQIQRLRNENEKEIIVLLLTTLLDSLKEQPT